MNISIVSTEVEIHETALEKITYHRGVLLVEFDNVHEQRVQLRFSPFQAARITTIDCFDVPSLLINDRLPRYLLEVVDSPWIEVLKEELRRNDRSATFMNKARHFILPLGDNIVEVIAHTFRYSVDSDEIVDDTFDVK